MASDLKVSFELFDKPFTEILEFHLSRQKLETKAIIELRQKAWENENMPQMRLMKRAALIC